MKHSKIKKLITGVIITITVTHQLLPQTFNAVWSEMQENYISMCRELERNTHIPMRTLLYHPQWQTFSAQIKQLIMGQPNKNFLQFPAIAATMVRSGMNIGQSYEQCYLTQCISNNTKELISRVKEPQNSTLARECKEFNCSANTLGQLYYAARILEQTDKKKLRSIVEFGGGYGCLAYIFKTILPQTKVYIIDIPELLSIQYVHLKNTLPNEKIHFHNGKTSKNIHTEGIHLIPTHIMMELDLQADVFVSNFALSEVTSHVQQMVAEKNFFNAHTCYITGQIDGWGSYAFENHENVHTYIRSCYEKVLCQPFHLFLASLKSYEIIAQR